MTSESKAMKRPNGSSYLRECASSEREYRIEAHDNLAYSNHPDINVYRLEPT
jgi:hypothetical protein